MAERLSHKKHTSPEDRGVDTHNIEEHSQQVTDAMRANYNLLTGKNTFPDVSTNESYTAIQNGAGSVAIVDSSSVNKFGIVAVFFDVKTMTISVDTADIIEIHQELESAGAAGSGTVVHTFYMAANTTVVVPFAFGDRLQAGDILLNGGFSRISVTKAGAGNVSVTVSGIARTA